MAAVVCANPVAAAAVCKAGASAAASSSCDCFYFPIVKVHAAPRRQDALVCVRNGGRMSLAVRASAKQAAVTTDAEAEVRWEPVIPVAALPRGERRLVRQGGETILLLWYKNDVFAIENTSPAEGAYSEGFFNAKLTQDGCIVCPSTETTFDLKTGVIKEWYPSNAVLRFLTKPVRNLDVYPVKMDSEYIYIDMSKIDAGQATEIIFSGATQAGKTATNVDVDEIRMVEVDEQEAGGFGFTPRNELINGRAAMLGFSMLLIIEATTGKGILKGTGFLDFLYRFLPGYPLI